MRRGGDPQHWPKLLPRVTAFRDKVTRCAGCLRHAVLTPYAAAGVCHVNWLVTWLHWLSPVRGRHAWTNTQTQTHRHRHRHRHTNTHTHRHTHRPEIDIVNYKCTYTNMHIQVCTQAHTHTFTHTHTHTFSLSLSLSLSLMIKMFNLNCSIQVSQFPDRSYQSILNNICLTRVSPPNLLLNTSATEHPKSQLGTIISAIHHQSGSSIHTCNGLVRQAFYSACSKSE